MFSLVSLLIDLASVLVGLLLMVYLYFQYHYRYWKNRNIPYFQPTFPYGNAKDIILEKLNFGETFYGFHKEAVKRNWSYVGLFMIKNKNLLVTDPELIKQILTTNFQNFQGRGVYHNEEVDPLSGHLVNISGPKWKRVRSKISPIFTSAKMKGMFPLIVKCCDALERNVEEHASKSVPIDAKNLMEKLTTDTIGSCVFGIDCNSFKEEESEFRKHAKSFFDNTLSDALKLATSNMFPSIYDFFRIRMIPKEASDYYTTIFKEIIKKRKESGTSRKDFIDLFMEIEKEASLMKSGGDEEQETISWNELAAQAFVFFMAGFETSSSTLHLCLHELACNLDIQEKTRNEILQVLKKHNGELTYNAVMEMNYLDQVICETLRKYPILSQLNRMCNKAFKVPNEDLVIEKGVMVFISILGLHMDPKYFPNPEKFDPDRFTEEAIASRPSNVYMPFGEGPRFCIGMRFAQLQIKVVLVILLRKYKYTLYNTAHPVKFASRGILLKTKDKTMLQVHKI